MAHQAQARTTLGVIVGNRGFFPDHLCDSGRTEILRVLEEEGIDVVALEPADTKFGTVMTLDDAKKCGSLFQANRSRIDGILVTLPNFGDEKGIANAIRYSGLDVPVLVHAFNDDIKAMSIKDRRDSFCGKMSVCNNLKQYGIPFSLTTLHTVDPGSESFRADLRRFAGTCRIVRSLRRARLGSIGARPASFNTVRYSEKLLERSGITIETLDLSEVFGRANKRKEHDPAVQRKLEEIAAYVDVKGFPRENLLRMASLGVVVEEWMKDNDLAGTALQCWTSMEEYFGIVPCTIMSMLSSNLIPSACEVDITGLVGMYALQQASGRPSALLDWNNNYGDDPDKGVVFHCSNLPKEVFEEIHMDYHEILSGTVGRENTLGTIQGRIKASKFTYCGVTTDDANGRIAAYTGEGTFTRDPLLTFGGYGVVQVPNFQKLLRYICESGFEHHVSSNMSTVADAVEEALGKYMGWSVYRHGADA
ncbi:L-fucose/L-arabinose isomerase family protein [Paenibacillus sp.]|uniref:L-fucose/L-arabinose isomerase family protein n=1 Tax=Paenibacillus sp. TaxID=58172 RepID=UPI002D50635C|nr:L-fucose/L-arabinose isomerase family protein [Paenibacillus sp.]HZG56942.1 L-fucose/L-arabinose isomerase family protein [Paenibacillus sp.]